MKLKTSLLIICPIIIVVALFIFFLAWKAQISKCDIYGSITDSLSGESVYGAQISVSDKITFCYLSTEYELTGISPEIYTLTAKAPGYSHFSERVTLKRGKNKLDIVLEGKEIPGLERIYAFSEFRQEGIELEIRFANQQNASILYYPCLNMGLWGVLYVRKGTYNNYSFGRKLYERSIELFWDAQADPWKYKGFIPWEDISSLNAEEKTGIMEVVLEIPGQGEYKTIVKQVKLQQF